MNDSFVWVLVSAGVTTAISTIVALIITRRFNKYLAQRDAEQQAQKKEDAELAKYREEEARKQRQEDVVQIVAATIKPFELCSAQITEKLGLLEDSALNTIRNDILTGYYDCVAKGYRNDYDYQNLHHMYEVYLKLKGNSYVTDIMTRFDDLPTKEEFKEKQKEKDSKKKVKRGTLKVLPQNKEKETK